MQSTPPSNVFDDLYQFQKIQSAKYFEKSGVWRFQTKKEAQQVLGIIMEAWNKHVAPLGDKLDQMTLDEKEDLFKAVDCGFG